MDAGDVVLALPPELSSIALARAHVWAQTESFAEHRRDDAQLLVSELVTNAIQHGAEEITLRITHEAKSVTVHVDDSGATMPEINAEVPQHATSGRGLQIVQALADQWGVRPRGHASGKTVWFTLAASQDSDDRRELVK